MSKVPCRRRRTVDRTTQLSQREMRITRHSQSSFNNIEITKRKAWKREEQGENERRRRKDYKFTVDDSATTALHPIIIHRRV